MTDAGRTPGLRDLVARATRGMTPPTAAAEAAQRCDLCAEPIAPGHRHVMDLRERRPLCACRACAIVFDREGAGGGHYRLIPDRYVELAGLEDADELWDSLGIPVGIAFFCHRTDLDRVAAYYPSPAGPTECELELDGWSRLAVSHPALREMKQDVEALLVNRAHGAREHWLVPVDACYRLVGIVRTHWQGISGGDEVRARIEAFFDELRRRARPPRK